MAPPVFAPFLIGKIEFISRLAIEMEKRKTSLASTYCNRGGKVLSSPKNSVHLLQQMHASNSSVVACLNMSRTDEICFGRMAETDTVVHLLAGHEFKHALAYSIKEVAQKAEKIS